MALPKKYQKHVGDAVQDLLGSVTRLLGTVTDAVRSAGGRDGTGLQGKSSHQVQGYTLGNGTRPGPGRRNPKLKSKLKAYWAKLTPGERKVRIAKMHAWRRAK